MGAGQMLKSLHERELIEVVGRGEGMGRPLLYGTTPAFLEHFALRHLGELPRGDELAIALRDPNAPPRRCRLTVREGGRSGHRITRNCRGRRRSYPNRATSDTPVAEEPLILDAPA